MLATLTNIKFDESEWQSRARRLWMIGIVTGVSYILASVINSMVVGVLTDLTVDSIKVARRKPTTTQTQRVTLRRKLNYRSVRKAVLGRNIFNSEGKVPEEKAAVAEAKDVKSTFNIDAPCPDKSTLPLELFGTIYLGPTGPSIAAIKDKTYSQADIYKEGDAIIGNDVAKIARIDQTAVIINNDGKKECLKMAPPKPSYSDPLGDDDYEDQLALEGDEEEGKDKSKKRKSGGDGSVVTLEASYVEEQLGKGGSNLLTKGRLVPFNPEGEMKGFKLIGLVPKSLFGRIGLKNGDVITQVNDTSMQEAAQGYSFYQVFESERDIVINVLRGGKTPMTLNVKIKD